MAMDPELAEALAYDPVYTQPLAPPEDMSLASFARQQSHVMLSPFSKYYRAQLPPGLFGHMEGGQYSALITFDLAESEYTVFNSLVPVDGGTIAVRLVTPGDETGTVHFPALVWIHGGGA